MKRSLFKLLATGSLLLPLFAACGDDEADSTTDEPAGPPSIRISGFIGADNRVAERSDENVIEACGSRFGVVIDSPENWTLRPPGRCGDAEQCGYVAVILDPESGAPISANSINLTTLLDLTGAPVFAGEGGGGGESAQGGAPGQGGEPLIAEGTHVVRVELRNDDGTAFVDATGAAVSDEAEVELSFVTCPSSGSGSGGEGGQPGAAGAPGGGAGGSGEGGAAGSGTGLGGEGGAGVGGEFGLGGAAGSP